MNHAHPHARGLLRSSSLLLPLLALVGCGQGPSPERTGNQSQASTVCAKGATTKGIDVSEYQGSIDWAKVNGSGIDFAIARVSDGSYMDKTFSANWPGMKSAGVIRGVYQYFEPGEDPTMQANIVISAVGKLGAGDLPAMLDVETTGGQSAATIVARIHTWVDAVQAGTGKKPMIYTGKWFWEPSVGDSADFASYPLVMAAYVSGCPNLPNAWSDWAIWQYTDTAAIPGISGNVDGDEYNGTLADLQAFAGGGGAAYGAAYVSQSWPLASTAMKMNAGDSVKASITLKNTGTKAWDSNTKLATSNARDRSSAFVAPDWLAPNRLDNVKGSVPPGSTYTFNFTFHAPATPGDYKEYFNLVEESVAWFSDPGQGGPPDNDIEAWITVGPSTAPPPSDAGGGDAGGTSPSGGDGGSSATGDDGGTVATGNDAGASGADGGPGHMNGGGTSMHGGCSSARRTSEEGRAWAAFALGAAALAIGARRKSMRRS